MYIYISLLPIEKFNKKEYKKELKLIPSFNSRTKIELEEDIYVYRLNEKEIATNMYHHKNIRKGIDLYIEEEEYLFIISEDRNDSEIVNIIKNFY